MRKLRCIDFKVIGDDESAIPDDVLKDFNEATEHIVTVETLTDGGYYSPWRRVWIVG